MAGAQTAAADPRVGGEIGVRYDALGGAAGLLGEPLTGEVRTPNGRGAYVSFQRGGIWWSPQSGAREVHGSILAEWGRTGWENGSLGFPVTDETRTPDGRGAYNVFQGGSVYWSPATGAREVHGMIRDAYAWSGWENGVLGFPVTSEVRTPNGRGAYNVFQGGSIYWSPATGAHVVHGAIRDAWAAQGWESGALGFPISSEFDIPGGKRVNFQRGYIEWNGARGALVNQSIAQPVAPQPPTVSQSNAVSKAESYLRYSAFSRSGLIGQLEYEGFSTADATYGVDHVQVDWYEQAEKKASSYLKYSSFSRQGLIDQLEFEGFTHDQAVHGVNSTGL